MLSPVHLRSECWRVLPCERQWESRLTKNTTLTHSLQWISLCDERHHPSFINTYSACMSQQLLSNVSRSVCLPLLMASSGPVWKNSIASSLTSWETGLTCSALKGVYHSCTSAHKTSSSSSTWKQHSHCLLSLLTVVSEPMTKLWWEMRAEKL